jgi:beta-lactamase superfamily II metal-dependent hydrolase
MDQLRIRMYNVGFGDCFLLFVPTDDGPRTLLLDCGKHMSSKTGHTISEAAQDIIDTVSADGHPRIDVVVATHRHYDHISGFDLKLWEGVEAGEVWMPWTEEVGNPAADKIRRNQNRLAQALWRRFGSHDDAVGALAFNSLSNKGAETQLRSGFTGNPTHRYLPETIDGAHSFVTDTLPGVTVHALGPSHDQDVIALMDPPAGKYFPDEPVEPVDGAPLDTGPNSSAADASTAQINSSFRDIFADHFRISADTFTSRYPTLSDHADTPAIDERSTFDMLAAAASVEDAINGTSLVFALDFGGVCVLLAGDAEWGTWSKILDDPASRALLARTRAYKVSHHGSFNGTPKPFVDDLLPDDAMSLVSLGPMKRWPSIPRKSLLAALEGKERRLMRTDQMPPDGDDVTSKGDLWVEIGIPLH